MFGIFGFVSSEMQSICQQQAAYQKAVALQNYHMAQAAAQASRSQHEYAEWHDAEPSKALGAPMLLLTGPEE